MGDRKKFRTFDRQQEGLEIMNQTSRKKALFIILSFLSLISLCVWGSFDFYQHFMKDDANHHHLLSIEDEMKHLDEDLTILSQMAAISSDVTWENHYRSDEEQLQLCIAEAKSFAIDAAVLNAIEGIDAANKSLRAVEKQSIASASAGNAELSRNLVESEEYRTMKESFLEHLESYSSALHSYLENHTQKSLAAILGVFAFFSFLVLAALFGFVWSAQLQKLLVERRLKQKELESANEQLEGTNQQLHASEQQLRAMNQQLEAGNQQLRAKEQQLLSLNHDLNERMKELNCFYGMSKILEGPAVTLEEIFQNTVRLIPPAWQYSEQACARIQFEGRHYQTSNFRETVWSQSCGLIVNGRLSGKLEVSYLEEMPEADEGPFVRQERDLLNSICERLGRVIERKHAEEALGESESRFMKMLQNSGDAIFLLGSETFLECNEATVEMFGYSSKEELMWIHPSEISPPVQPER